MVSSEMTEIIGMCERVIVMAEGRVTAELIELNFRRKELWQPVQRPRRRLDEGGEPWIRMRNLR